MADEFIDGGVDRPQIGPGVDECIVRQTDGGFTFREQGSRDRWMWVADRDSLVDVEQ